MNQNEALQILINGVRAAQKRGAFELEEAPVIAQAVEVFMPKKEEVKDEKSTEKKGKKKK